MVSVAVRAVAAGLGAVDTAIVPDPDPLAAESAAHDADDEVAHAHPEGAVTATLAMPPPLVNDVEVGDTV